jgi:hypothetical protein
MAPGSQQTPLIADLHTKTHHKLSTILDTHHVSHSHDKDEMVLLVVPMVVYKYLTKLPTNSILQFLSDNNIDTVGCAEKQYVCLKISAI